MLFGSAFILDLEGMKSLGFEIVLWRSLDEPELKSSSEESLPKIIFSRAFFGVYSIYFFWLASEEDELWSLAGGVNIVLGFGFVSWESDFKKAVECYGFWGIF